MEQSQLPCWLDQEHSSGVGWNFMQLNQSSNEIVIYDPSDRKCQTSYLLKVYIQHYYYKLYTKYKYLGMQNEKQSAQV